MTQNHNYETPTEGTLDWHVPLNSNFERIDTDVEIRDVEANRNQYQPKDGAKFVATDTGNQFVGDGSSWNPLPAPATVRTRLDDLESRISDLEGSSDGSSDGSSGGSSGGATNVDAHLTFEDDSYRDTFTYLSAAGLNSVTSSAGRNGNGLRVGIPQDEHYGTSMGYEFGPETGSEPEAASARYWLYVPDSFTFADSGGGGSKLPGFAGRYGEAGWGGRVSDGTNGWSARMSTVNPGLASVSEDVGLSFYVYHPDQNYSWGSTFIWDIGVNRGQWHRIDQYVQMNTPGEHDGVLRGWVDGSRAYEKTDLRFRDVTDLKIQEFWFNVYHGGSWTSPTDTSLHFDDLKLKRDSQLV